MLRISKVLLYITLVLAGFLLMALLFTNKLIYTKITNTWNQWPVSAYYKLTTKRVTFNPFTGTLKMYELQINATSKKTTDLYVYIPELSIENGIWSYFFSHSFPIKTTITLQKPVVKISTALNKEEKITALLPNTSQAFATLTLKDASLTIYDTAVVDSIKLLHWNLIADTLKWKRKEEGIVFSTSHIHWEANDAEIQIDTSYWDWQATVFKGDIQDFSWLPNHYCSWKHDSIQIRNLTTDSSSTNYLAAIDSLDCSLHNGYLQTSKLKIFPQKDETTFSQTLKYAGEQYTVKIDSLKTTGLSIDSLLQKKMLFIDTLHLYYPNIYIYRNTTKAIDPKTIRWYPAQQVSRLGGKFKIAVCKLHHTEITYTEQKHFKQNTISVLLSNTRLNHLTNLATSIPLNLYTQGVIGKKIRFSAVFSSDYTTENVVYDIAMHPFKSEDINRTMAMVSPVEFTNDGIIDSIRFAGIAGEGYAKGTLLFLYHHLHVKTKNQPFLIKQMMQFITRQTILSENPQPGKPPRIITVFQVRDKHRSLVNLLVKTMTKGMFEATKTKSVRFIEKKIQELVKTKK